MKTKKRKKNKSFPNHVKKSFADRVKYDQEKQGFHVFKVPKDVRPLEREPIDLIGMKHGQTIFIRARGNGHGDLYKTTILRLQALGKKCGAKVLHAKENGAQEIVYFRIYDNEGKWSLNV